MSLSSDIKTLATTNSWTTYQFSFGQNNQLVKREMGSWEKSLRKRVQKAGEKILYYFNRYPIPAPRGLQNDSEVLITWLQTNCEQLDPNDEDTLEALIFLEQQFPFNKKVGKLFRKVCSSEKVMKVDPDVAITSEKVRAVFASYCTPSSYGSPKNWKNACYEFPCIEAYEINTFMRLIDHPGSLSLEDLFACVGFLEKHNNFDICYRRRLSKDEARLNSLLKKIEENFIEMRGAHLLHVAEIISKHSSYSAQRKILPLLASVYIKKVTAPLEVCSKEDLNSKTLYWKLKYFKTCHDKYISLLTLIKCRFGKEFKKQFWETIGKPFEYLLKSYLECIKTGKLIPAECTKTLVNDLFPIAEDCPIHERQLVLLNWLVEIYLAHLARCLEESIGIRQLLNKFGPLTPPNFGPARKIRRKIQSPFCEKSISLVSNFLEKQEDLQGIKRLSEDDDVSDFLRQANNLHAFCQNFTAFITPLSLNFLFRPFTTLKQKFWECNGELLEQFLNLLLKRLKKTGSKTPCDVKIVINELFSIVADCHLVDRCNSLLNLLSDIWLTNLSKCMESCRGSVQLRLRFGPLTLPPLKREQKPSLIPKLIELVPAFLEKSKDFGFLEENLDEEDIPLYLKRAHQVAKTYDQFTTCTYPVPKKQNTEFKRIFWHINGAPFTRFLERFLEKIEKHPVGQPENIINALNQLVGIASDCPLDTTRKSFLGLLSNIALSHLFQQLETASGLEDLRKGFIRMIPDPFKPHEARSNELAMVFSKVSVSYVSVYLERCLNLEEPIEDMRTVFSQFVSDEFIFSDNLWSAFFKVIAKHRNFLPYCLEQPKRDRCQQPELLTLACEEFKISHQTVEKTHPAWIALSIFFLKKNFRMLDLNLQESMASLLSQRLDLPMEAFKNVIYSDNRIR